MLAHILEMAEGGSCQETERNQPSEAHSQTGDGKGRDLSGHINKPTDQGALTSWRRQRDGFVRTRKETDRERCTHKLETVEGGTCQGTERTDRARRTHQLEMTGGGTCQGTKETDQAMRTHKLEGGTCQDTERNRPSKAHSHAGDGRGRDLSGHGMNVTGRWALTSWRTKREGQVRTCKEYVRAMRG